MGGAGDWWSGLRPRLRSVVGGAVTCLSVLRSGPRIDPGFSFLLTLLIKGQPLNRGTPSILDQGVCEYSNFTTLITTN